MGADAGKADGGEVAAQGAQGGEGDNGESACPDELAGGEAERRGFVFEEVIDDPGERPGFEEAHQGHAEQGGERGEEQRQLAVQVGAEAVQDAADGGVGHGCGWCLFLEAPCFAKRGKG